MLCAPRTVGDLQHDDDGTLPVLECSVHQVAPCSSDTGACRSLERFVRQLYDVFPDALEALSGVPHPLLVVPCFQPCKLDLVAVGPAAEEEKNLCLHRFVCWAQGVCAKLRVKGYWADFTDPCSGYPMLGQRGTAFYADVLGSQRLLKYDMVDTGCCKLISHPAWGTKVYPTTVFAACPPAELELLVWPDCHAQSFAAQSVTEL